MRRSPRGMTQAGVRWNSVREPDRGLDLRDELNSRRAGTDHRYPPVAQVIIQIPARGVEHFS
jgi:hypothetical protein